MLPVFISCLFENLFWENLLFNINIVILLIVVDTAFPLMSHELQQSSDTGQPTVNNEWYKLELQRGISLIATEQRVVPSKERLSENGAVQQLM